MTAFNNVELASSTLNGTSRHVPKTSFQQRKRSSRLDRRVWAAFLSDDSQWSNQARREHPNSAGTGPSSCLEVGLDLVEFDLMGRGAAEILSMMYGWAF